MPAGNRQLAGEQRGVRLRRAPAADFEKIATFGFRVIGAIAQSSTISRSTRPVDRAVLAAAVGTRGGEAAIQFRRFLKERGVAIPAGFLEGSLRQPLLPDSRQFDQKQVLVFANPG